MGFADVGNLSGESGADFAIQRDRHEGFAPFGLRGIKNHLAVGRKTGFFIVGAVGQRQGLVGGQLHQLKLDHGWTPLLGMSKAWCLLLRKSLVVKIF